MKRAISVLLAFVCICSVLVSVPMSVTAETLCIRKIVSVVYDDSGSMKGDKSAYANYAVQSFCGMLNGDDRLFITYMSKSIPGVNYDPDEVDLSAGGIQASVDSIRSHTKMGDTPYTAVETAFNKLKGISDPDPNTQYWLVVITDGSFQECEQMDEAGKIEFLNNHFNEYTETVMPNGTKPQVTFLGIGDVATPTENTDKGIYPFEASDAGGIIQAMSKMADRISGRTRLQKNDVKLIDDKTVQVSSSIPLLNISVILQGSQAKVVKAVDGNGADIPTTRRVSLSYPKYEAAGLIGGAFLLGDSQHAIGSGTYNITFDQKVDLDDVIILFDPALEMRMSISLNGKELEDISGIDSATEGDKITVSFKLYETGTDTEIDSSLLPKDTSYEISVAENGKTVDTISGKELILSDYVLKNIGTEIKASATIGGFNPIKCALGFTPREYVPTYTVSASFGSDEKSVKLNEIANNRELSVCFTVYADGVEMTDPDAVKTLNPVITSSPDGNHGIVSYADDGRIVYTPNAAPTPATNVPSFDVEVTCTVGTASASEVYKVLVAEYEVISAGADGDIRKNELVDNKVSASFYITKDGVKLDKSAVENNISVSFNEEYSTLRSNVTVADDGTVTVTPYSEDRHKMNWWTNWCYYFGLEGEDITVTMSHPLGTAECRINVVDADLKYLLLNVILPMLTEAVILALIIAYIFRCVTKPKFASDGVLYVGSIERNVGYHNLLLRKVQLKHYNKLLKILNPFTEMTAIINNISITAARGNQIICNEQPPCYTDKVRAKKRSLGLNSPGDIAQYCRDSGELAIAEILPRRRVENDDMTMTPDDTVYYFVKVDIKEMDDGMGTTNVIDSAKVFCYTTIE